MSKPGLLLWLLLPVLFCQGSDTGECPLAHAPTQLPEGP